mgnify:CR=1 FL=1
MVEHSISETLVLNSIVLSAGLFGSIYLFSTSLNGLNKKWMKDERFSLGAFEILNGGLMLISGILIVVSGTKTFNIINKY